MGGIKIGTYGISRITRVISGEGTGDSIYIDEKGRKWYPTTRTECGTGEILGIKTNGHIKEIRN